MQIARIYLVLYLAARGRWRPQKGAQAIVTVVMFLPVVPLPAVAGFTFLVNLICVD